MLELPAVHGPLAVPACSHLALCMFAEWHDDKLFEELPSSISGEVASFLTREVFEKSDVFRCGSTCTLDVLPVRAFLLVCQLNPRLPIEPCLWACSLQAPHICKKSHIISSKLIPAV